ncbi:MAG: DNA oxidative demethylase AlkB [Pseudomonadota bacterium]|nr:DNA oxidative demethylase AlkB [Pseudomonadota bacterium]
MTLDLFDTHDASAPDSEPLGDGAVVLRSFARSAEAALWADVQAVIAAAPLRHFVTPGGLSMAVATTNCGPLGWISDRRGYRYVARDPDSGAPWPLLPATFGHLARAAAAAAGYAGFAPDACLVNRYVPRTRLSLHQDRDEKRLDAPIVSVSLGLPASFQWGGLRRGDPTVRLVLRHGDVVVWGGRSRLRFHGVLPLADGEHALLGRQRINLTFRQAG